MKRVSRAERAGEKAAASSPSKLRLFLIVAVGLASAAAFATTSTGLQVLALAAGGASALAGALSGSGLALIAAAAALVLGLLFIVRRRGKAASVPVRRAFRSQPAPVPRNGEPAMQAGGSGRSAFLAGLQDRLKAHAEEGRQLAVHRIDIDRFRQINARFGAAAGDRVLGEASRRLAELAGDPAHLARLGDDEFAVIQPEAGGAKHAEIFAARMQKALEEPIAAGEAEIAVTASIGIAVAPEHGSEAERLLICADMALEKAQRTGQGLVRCFAAAMDERLVRRRAVEDAVRAALKEEPARLALRYRPQYDLGSRRLVGFGVEALLKDPGLGTLGEAEVAAAADSVGLLPAMAERVVREACRTAARWPQHLRLGFRLLPGHCRSRDTARLLSEALKANHLSPGRVDLLVHQEVVSSGSEQTLEQLRRLAEAGFRLVLDGYGGGGCGPAELWGGPFSAVRIDAGLVGRIGSGEGVETLVGAMVKLAQALGLVAIADGAERVEQAHFLMLNGCRHVCGPLLGPAVAADKVAGIIEKDARMGEAGEQAAAA